MSPPADVTMADTEVTSPADDSTKTVVTSRRRWVVLAASFLAIFVTGYGQVHSGVMKVVLVRHLDSDVNKVTWIVSYYGSLFALAAPVASTVINVTSCRTCVVLSGVLCLLGFVLSSLVTDITYLIFTFTLLGIGQALCTTGAILILGFYFPGHANIAVGVSISGGALGIFFHPPLLQTLVDWYGLRGALMLSGAIAFHASALGALMTPCSLELRVVQGSRGGNVLQKLCALCAGARSLHRSPLTSRSMTYFLLSVFLFSFSYHVFLVLLPYYLVHVGGLTPIEASFAVSMVGIGSLFSRLVAGVLAQDPAVGAILTHCGLLGVQTLVTLMAPSLIAQGIVGSYAFSFMIGLYTGGSFALVYPVTRAVVGFHYSSTAYGVAMCIVGVGALLGAPLMEMVQEQSSNAYVMFGSLGALLCTAAVLGFLVTGVPSSDVSTCPGQLKSPSNCETNDPEEEATQLNQLSSNDTKNEVSWKRRQFLGNETGEFPPTTITYSGSGKMCCEEELPDVERPLLEGGAEVRTSEKDCEEIRNAMSEKEM